jgi:hypothetical protein
MAFFPERSVETDKITEAMETLSNNDLKFLLNNIGKRKPDIINGKKSLTYLNPTINNIIKQPQKAVSSDFITTCPDYLDIALGPLTGLSFARRFDIFETGMYLGILLGRSTKKDVIRIMKDFSSCNIKENDPSLIFSYYDISLTVTFNKYNIVNEITLDGGFKGQTSKGLKIGDTTEKALEIYGKPTSRSSLHLKWEKLVIYTQENIVTHIRLKM